MTGWDKAKVEKLIGIALSFLIALLSVIGYDVVIARPAVDGLTRQVQALQGPQLEPLIEAPAGQ
jgi:hypothetical protein